MHHNDTLTKCKYCQSDNLISKTHLSGKHWGEVKCEDCERHLQWLPDPAITASFEARQQLIDQALASGRVTGWENLFLRNIRKTRTLSPKRQEKFNQICSRHGFTKIPASSNAGTG